MNSILLLIFILLLLFSVVAVATRLGKEYLIAMMAGMGVLIAFSLVHPLEIFGWPILLAEVFYAIYFLSTDILAENFGEKYAKKSVWVMLGGLALTVSISKIIILLDSGPLGTHLENFFEPISITLLFAGLFVIFLEQRFDIFLFAKIKQKTKGKYLWLRNSLSTMSAQFLDTVIVYPIFFYTIFGSDVWELMLVALLLKFVMSVLDTPIIYLSKKLVTH